MDINTQLGGPYRPENHALFEVKNKLVAAGVDVRQPMGDNFVIGDDGKSYGFHPLAATLKQVELDFLRSIATCDLHFVCNELGTAKGHIGENTAKGMLYAIRKNKPIMLLNEPRYANTVAPDIKQILRECQDKFIIFDPRKHTTPTILRTFLKARRTTPAYNLNAAQKTLVRVISQKNISDLL
ncbi:MAG TPA: hypothetical protein VLA77_02350 [Candidatus Saccharimonadales bacterium]|nr:hypothetical protein [Candidatus Saccharimonadales bacterium]